MTQYIAITCSALARSIYAVAANAPVAVAVRTLNQGLHRVPENLRDKLQAQIDAIEPDECDAVLLIYGLCGTSTEGLMARDVPLVIPRVHDCIALYLGSHGRYLEEFNAHPGTYWYSVDYLERRGAGAALGASFSTDFEERYDEYVEKYGQDNADYLMEVMGQWTEHYSRAAFIATGAPNSEHYEQKARDQAERRNWVFERKLADRRMLELITRGEWPEDEFLVVPPGHTIVQTYDDRVVGAVPAEMLASLEEADPR